MDCQLQDGRIARFTADVTAFPIASTMFVQIERRTNPPVQRLAYPPSPVATCPSTSCFRASGSEIFREVIAMPSYMAVYEAWKERIRPAEWGNPAPRVHGSSVGNRRGPHLAMAF